MGAILKETLMAFKISEWTVFVDIKHGPDVGSSEQDKKSSGSSRRWESIPNRVCTLCIDAR
jgi:hypothetical protein